MYFPFSILYCILPPFKCRYLVIVNAGANRGMTVGRSVLIIIFCKTFAARFWYLRGGDLTTSMCGTPGCVIKVVSSPRHSVNAAAFELKYCMPSNTRDKIGSEFID